MKKELTVKKNGKVVEKYDNGNIRYSGTYKDRKMNGLWKFFRKDGSLMRSGKFKDGEQVGVWKTFLRTGEVAKETNFSKA